MHLIPALVVLAMVVPTAGVSPRAAECDRENRYCAEVQRLASDPRVRRALAAVQADSARARRELIELTQIPAPPFKEEARGRRYLAMLKEAGADSVWTDSVGNVVALRRGTRRDRTIVMEGHLDTVFPEETDVTVKLRGDTLAAPGIADDTRGLVAVLGVLRALSGAEIRTEADLQFIGTVGEEGLGDLRGVKHLFRPGAAPIHSYIAVEPGEGGIAVAGIGSHRYRVTFRGPGGHSWGAFGTANPVHALGRAIALFDDRADRATRAGARTTYNVGRIGGGTSVNSVPFEAWMEVDIRSEENAGIRVVDEMLQEAVRQALREQNAILRRDAPLTADVELVGQRPSGAVDRSNPLVQRSSAVVEHFGGTANFRSGSTNSNIPFSRGVPAVTIGAGGRAGDSHSLTEWWVDEGGTAYRSVQQALLLLVAEAALAR